MLRPSAQSREGLRGPPLNLQLAVLLDHAKAARHERKAVSREAIPSETIEPSCLNIAPIITHCTFV